MTRAARGWRRGRKRTLRRRGMPCAPRWLPRPATAPRRWDCARRERPWFPRMRRGRRCGPFWCGWTAVPGRRPRSWRRFWAANASMKQRACHSRAAPRRWPRRCGSVKTGACAGRSGCFCWRTTCWAGSRAARSPSPRCRPPPAGMTSAMTATGRRRWKPPGFPCGCCLHAYRAGRRRGRCKGRQRRCWDCRRASPWRRGPWTRPPPRWPRGRRNRAR